MAGPIRKTTTTTKTKTTRRRTSGARNTFDAIVRGAEKAVNAAIPKHGIWYTKAGQKAGQKAVKAAKRTKNRYRG